MPNLEDRLISQDSWVEGGLRISEGIELLRPKHEKQAQDRVFEMVVSKCYKNSKDMKEDKKWK